MRMNSRRLQIGVLLATVVLLPATWYYVAHIWSPPTRGVDLYPYWYGSRELLLHGRNPYSPEVHREIMQWVYGRAPLPGEDSNRFAYPPWVSVLMAPAVAVEYSKVDAFFFWALLALTLASVPCWLRVVGWKPSRCGYATVLLLTLGSLAVSYGALLRQLSLVAGFIVALAAALLSAGALIPAGILLGVATIKPQLIVLLLPWLLAWCFSDWKERKRLFLSFSVTLTLLVTISFAIMPDWPREFARTMAEYSLYNDGRSVLQLMFTRQPGRIAAICIVAAVLWQSWGARKSRSGTHEFSNCLALLLAATIVVIPTIAVYNQVLLIPGLFVMIRDADGLWHGSKAARLAFVACWILFACELLAALGLTLAVLLLHFDYARALWSVPVTLSALTPPAVLLVLSFVVRTKGTPAPEKRSAALVA
jgi:hypothetical protein